MRKVQAPKEETSADEKDSLVMKMIADLEWRIAKATSALAPTRHRGQTAQASRPSLKLRIPPHSTRLMQTKRKPKPSDTAVQSLCWGCGAAGHFLRQCTTIPEGEKGKYVPASLGFAPRANPIKQPLSPQHACISVTSKGRTILVLIDTGSDITLVGRLLAEQLSWDMQPTNLWHIVAANDDKMSILGVCYFKLGVSSRFLGTRTYVTSRIHQIILGADRLAEEDE